MVIQFKTSGELPDKLKETSFSDLFDLVDIQHLQDLFADAHGVASVITDTAGKLLTEPSNFTTLCENIIRKTEKGCANCYQSDDVIGRYNPDGPIVETCPSGGLWEAVASITVGGRHIANWFIGQVRIENMDEGRMMEYADKIGANKADFDAALKNVPVMSADKFHKIADLLFVFANELSSKTYSNFQLNVQIDEKDKANAKLLEREENLSIMLQSIGDGVISTDKNGMVMQMNPVAEMLCGWKLADALGKPLTEVFTIINAETRQTVADPVKKVLDKGEIVGLANHTVLVSRNGTEYQISDSAAPIKNKKGEITGVVLVFSDVTANYVAQKQIKESEGRFRSLLNNLEAGIVVHAADTSIVMNNQRAIELLGLTNDQMKGKVAIDPAWKFVHEDNTPFTLDEYPVNKIVKSKKPIKNQILGIHQPGRNDVVWVMVNGFPVLDIEGRIAEIVISFIDFTRQKLAEDSLRESEERFKALHNASFGGITIHDKGLIMECNRGLSDITGYSHTELIGMDGLLLIAPESRDLVIGKINSGFEKPYEAFGIRKNGEIYPIRLEARDVPYKEKMVRTVEFRDITEQKKANLLIQQKTEEIEAQNEEYQQLNEELIQRNQELAAAKEKAEESEEKFSKSFFNSPDSIILSKLDDGKIVKVNNGFRKLMGYEEAEVIGKTTTELNFYKNPEERNAIINALKTTGQVLDIECWFITKYGEEKLGLLSAAIIVVDGVKHIISTSRDITDRKKAEVKLALLSARQEAILDAVPDILMEVDNNKIYTWANHEGIKFFGDDVIGKEAAFYFEGEQETYNTVQPLFSGSKDIAYVQSWQHRKDGENRLLAWTCRSLKDNQGNVTGTLSSAHDITEQKKSEILLLRKTAEIEAQNEEYQQLNEELNQANQELAITLLRAEESEAVIKAAMENSQAGIAIAECPSGKLKYVNKAALMIRGKEYDEIVKDINLDKYVSSWKILHFDGTPYKPDEVPLARAILYGETNSGEFIIRRDTHEDRYVWANAAPIFNAQGIQTSAIVVFLDITERKLAEQALKQSEEKYQSIIQSQSEGIGVINQNEVFEFANLAAEKIFETGPGELIGASLYDFLHPEETGKINFQTGERQQGNSGTYEIHIITKKGNAKYILVSSSPKLDENKNYIGAYGVFRDITERRLLNDVHSFLSISGYPGSGQNFFESLAKYLSEILDSEYVCIDKLEGDGLTAQTVAIYNEGKFDPNVSYTLKQTPCGDVVGKNICCFPENVCQLFPQDEALQELKAHSYIGTTLWSFNGKPIGLIAIIGQKPMKNAAFAENVLKLVAIRAAGELERRLAEEKLCRNERELKRAQQITHIGSWYLDLVTNEVVWSEELYKMYGFDPALPPPSYTEHMKLFTSESWDLLSVSLENTRQTGIPYELELRTVRSDGSNGWMWVRGEAIQDKEAKTIGLWGAAQDISEEKLIQEELIKAKLKTEESEAFFRSIFENSPVGKSITGLDGSLKTNKSFSDMLGYSFDEFQAKNFTDITHPDDIQKSKEVIEALLTGKESVIRFEKKYIHKNGSVVYSEVLTTLQKNREGKPLFFITTVQNITERKLSEKALKESEERFKNMFERHSSIMLLVDPESGMIINANDASVRFYGYSKPELLSMCIDQINIQHPDLVKMEREQALREEETYFIFPHRLANGEVRTVEVHSSPIVFEDHQILFSIIHDITERKKAEEVSKKEQALSNAIIESIPGTFYMLDETGQYVRWNAYQRDEIVGKPDELVGRTNALDTIHPNDRELIQSKIANVLANGVVEIVESRVLLRGGPASRWMVMTGSRMLIDGHPFLVGIGIDITERKLAEEKLKESELKYRSLIENTSDAIFCVDEKGEYKFTNNLFASTFGKSPDDFVGKTFWDIYDKQHADYRYETVKRVFLTGKSETIEVEVPLPDKTLYFLASSNPIKDETGRVILNLTHATDITKIKMAEHELQLAMEIADVNTANITAIIEGTADSIWAFNEQFEIVYINQVFKREFHQSFGIWLEPGSSLVNSLPETIRPFWKQRYDRVLNNEQFTVEDAVDTGNGTLYIQVSFNPIIKKGQVIGGSCFGSDITSRKLAEIELIKAKAQAEESDRLKSAFLANMSHEIRTPMNGILGFAEILKDPELSGDQQKEYIKIIERSGKRMLNIINDIVDISKIEAGLMKLNITESDINEQIEYIYTFFKPEVEAKGMKLSFKTTMSAREANILTDREKVYAILTNLVKNAIKYSNEGSIELGYSVKEMGLLTGGMNETGLIEFYVRDTGIGIPHNRQEAIFERFIQADITDKLALQGAGLGLAITKSYVEMLGGKIWVESQEGEGSTFYFTLPYNHISDSNNSAQSSVSVNEKYNWSKKLKILIAEDDQASEMLISLMVNTFCGEILKVETGIDAIECCRNNPDIDLILMDIQMPKMGGYEATRQIREFNKNVFIIAQTAYGLSGDREKAIEAGCNDYLSKPINKAELLAKIHKHFNN